MKKIFILFFIFLAAGAAAAQDVQDEFLGQWQITAGVIEQEDGLLVSSDAVYSFPYLGLTQLDFLDSGFVVFSISTEEYRAFYEIDVLDFDNYHISCSFKNGEVFLLKLVRTAEGWRYLYRITEGSVLKGEAAVEDEEAAEENLTDSEGETSPEESQEEPLSSLYTGMMTRLR